MGESHWKPTSGKNSSKPSIQQSWGNGKQTAQQTPEQVKGRKRGPRSWTCGETRGHCVLRWQDLANPNADCPSQSFLVEACRSLNSNHLKFIQIQSDSRPARIFRQVLQPLQKPWNLFPSPILITVAGLLSESTGETTRSTKLPSIQVPRWLTSFTASIWWFGPCWRSRSCHLADLALLVVGRRVLQVSQLIFKRSWAEPCNKSHTRQF